MFRILCVLFQYFDRTNEVFESLLKCDNVEDLESADMMLVELQESQINIGTYHVNVSFFCNNVEFLP